VLGNLPTVPSRTDSSNKQTKMESISKHEVGRHDAVPITQIKDIPTEMMSRPVSKTHVRTIRTSIFKLTYFDKSFPLKLIVMGSHAPDRTPYFTINDEDIKIPNWPVIFAHAEIYPAAGMHRLHAMRELMDLYPTNEKWQTVPAVIYHYPIKDQVSISEIKVLGGQDNSTAETQRKVTYAERMFTMHSNIYQTFGQAGPPTGKQQSRMTQLAEDWRDMWGVGIDNDIPIAKWPEPAWDIAWKIISGDYLKPDGQKSGKQLGSSRHFYGLNALDTDDAIEVMKKAVHGGLAVEGMPAYVATVRNNMALRQYMMKYFRVSKFDDLSRICAPLCAREWLESTAQAITAEHDNKVVTGSWVPPAYIEAALKRYKNKSTVRICSFHIYGTELHHPQK
jgi:hypothetical protein